MYPYLLHNLRIHRAGHFWCADVTYIPMAHGFLYVVAIMDWHSRKVLSSRLSNWNAQDFLDTLEPLKIVGRKLPRGHAADVTVSPL